MVRSQARSDHTGARALRIRALAVALLLLAALGIPAAVAPNPARGDTAPPDTTLPATVSSDPLPTVQINGVVYAQTVVNNIVYAGGSFSRARPAGAAAGTQEVVRNNFVAYNVATGVMTSFAPSFNGTIETITTSPDGLTLFVLGRFTTVNGVTRNRVASFTIATGALTGFNPNVNSTVLGGAATASTLYIGGNFTSVNGVTRQGGAAITIATNTVTGYAPVQAGGVTRRVLVAPDGSSVIVGGNFTSMNGSNNPGYGLARLNPATGGTLPLPVNTLIRNAGANSAIYDLAGNASGFYGVGYVFSQQGGNLEGTFKADWNGNFTWIEDCHGDHYSVFPSGNEVYTAGHAHYCGNISGYPQTDPRANWTYQRGLAFSDDIRGTVLRDPYGYFNFEGRPRPALLHWLPDFNTGTYTGLTQGPWHVSANSNYVLYGGEFTRVNNVPQQGLVRFARTNLAPNDDGPRLGTSSFLPTATNFAQGVRVSWESNYDRDNEQLSYDVIRNGDLENPIFSTTSRSAWWQRPYLGYLDTDVTAGQSYSYQIRATDPKGNSAYGNPISITATRTGTSLSVYDQVALGDGPQSYWAYNEGTGSTAADLNGVDPGTRSAGVIGGVPGAIAGHPGTAYRFIGNSTSFVSTTGTARKGPQVFSMEAWFKTTTTAGGKIIGYGNRSTGNSTSYDRHLYMSSNGRLYLGVNPDARTINTTTSYNDGQWHHAVATLSLGGLRLYVDGVERAANPNIVDASALLEGYWRVGGDALGNWPGASGGSYFNGDIDNPAIYRVALTPGQVAAHYAARTGVVPNQPPIASFNDTSDELSASFDAGASTDPDGTIVSYAWAFGDGDVGTGITTTHDYDDPGTYPVTLTVTDDDGEEDSVTRNVVITATPNQPPNAAFTSSTSDLTASFNGSGSTDSDGTITAYAWDFDDGESGTGATTTHEYDAAGTYSVTLTVTDNDGDEDSVTHDVTVTDPPNPSDPFVNDQFNRTLATGLGTADVGGAWTVSTASGFGVGSGAGLWKLSTPGVTRSAYLGSTLRDSTDLVMNLSADKNAAGGTTFAWVEGRRVSANTEYRSVLRFTTSNSLSVGIEALKGSTTATVLAAPVTVGNITAGTQIHVRMQTFGTNSTTIRTKVWLGAASEPAAWTVTTTDNYGPLQVPGAVGLITYASGAATNTPVTVSVSDIVARPMP